MGGAGSTLFTFLTNQCPSVDEPLPIDFQLSLSCNTVTVYIQLSTSRVPPTPFLLDIQIHVSWGTRPLSTYPSTLIVAFVHVHISKLAHFPSNFNLCIILMHFDSPLKQNSCKYKLNLA